MIKYRITPVLASLFMALIVSQTQAEKDHAGESHHDDHKDGAEESLEAHVHGAAELFVVLDGQELEIELHSPAANLLGFEHEARNAEEKEKIANLKLSLAKADTLFTIGSGACTLKNQELDLGHLAGDEEHHGDEHADEEHEDGHHDEQAHSDIEAQYRYSCEQADKIRTLETSITSEFPSIESLEVQWIVNGRQGATILKSQQREVVFK